MGWKQRVRAAGMRRRSNARFGAVLVSFAVAVTTAVLAAPVTPPAMAADATADRTPVIFILDASGSMVREVSKGTTRMDVAKKALNKTLDALPDDSEVGVLVFGTGTGNTDAERAAGCADVKTLAPLGTLDARALTQQVGKIKESGFTPIGPALRQAFSMVPSGSAANIVLISDGVDTCAPPPSCEVAAQLHRDNPLVSINVVGFGIDEDEAAQQQMTCIGGVGGGTAVSASDPAQLIARLDAATTATTDASKLSAQGTRGVELGMSLDEVRAAVDGAKVGKPKTVDRVIVIEVDCGWGTVVLHNGRVWSITLKQKKAGTTAEGISPGDTLDRAEALYGDPVDRSSTNGSSNSSVVYQTSPGSTSGYRMFYDPSTKKVKYIIVCRCVPRSVIAAEDPSTWEITYDGVGPLILGMTLEEARAVVPDLQPAKRGNWTVAWSMPSDSYQTWSATSSGGTWLWANFSSFGILAEVSVGDNSNSITSTLDGAQYPNARGIRIGQSMSTVINAFPDGTFLRNLAGGRSDYMKMDRNGHLMTFDVRRSSSESTDTDLVKWMYDGTVAMFTVSDVMPHKPGSTHTASPTTQPSSDKTEIVTVNPFSSDGTLLPGWTMRKPEQREPMDCGYGIPAVGGVTPNTYWCEDGAESAISCWAPPTTPGYAVCVYDPTTHELRVIPAAGMRGTTPKAEPDPLYLELDDGSQWQHRSGGAWGGRSDGYAGAYACTGDCGPGENTDVILTKPDTAPVDRSADLWTVLVGPLGAPNDDFPAPTKRVVTKAWFIASTMAAPQ